MVDKPVILITGASSGIGEASAYRFARKGYGVVLAARRKDRLEWIAEQISEEGGDALPLEADISQIEEVNFLVEACLQTYGRIDILFNNAGLGYMNWLNELNSEDNIRPQVEVNLIGLIEVTRAVLPHMIHSKKGHIINMASIAGLIGTPTYSIYAATKFGIRGFSEALRREVGIYGIRVSVIYPGAVANDFGQKARIVRKSGLTTPNWLVLSSDEVAEQVLKLSEHPRFSVVTPGIFQLAVFINGLFPGLVDWIIQKRFVQVEKRIQEDL